MARRICIACGSVMKPWFWREGFMYLRCRLCGSTSIDPVPTGKQITSYYSRKFKSGNYHLVRVFALQYKRIYQQYVDALTARLAETGEKIAGKKILDVGCFTGDFLELMERAGASVYGTELQKSAVKIASKRFPGRIFSADLETKNFPAKKFQIVSLLGLIEHVTSPDQLLTSTTRLLESEGVLIIQTPDAGSRFARLLGKWWPPLSPIEHIHVFSALGLKLLLSKYGYTDIRIYPHVKHLPIAYVYRQFSNFGRHFGRLLRPFDWFLRRIPSSIVMPFYGGEIIVIARKAC